MPHSMMCPEENPQVRPQVHPSEKKTSSSARQRSAETARRQEEVGLGRGFPGARCVSNGLVRMLVVLVSAAAQPVWAAQQSQPSTAPDADLRAESTTAAAEAGSDGLRTDRTLQERIRAVSRRWFLKRQRFELEPQFGFTANDALNRAWSFGARASYHFNEEFALDVGGGGGFNQPLEDIRVLTEDVVLPKGSQQLGYADVGVTFSPFYGKLALMAEHVVHFDGYISAGLGAIVDDSAAGVHPAVEFGVGARVFLSRWLTLRSDVRNYTYPLEGNGRLSFPSSLIISVGLGIFFPLDFDYSTESIGGKA